MREIMTGLFNFATGNIFLLQVVCKGSFSVPVEPPMQLVQATLQTMSRTCLCARIILSAHVMRAVLAVQWALFSSDNRPALQLKLQVVGFKDNSLYICQIHYFHLLNSSWHQMQYTVHISPDQFSIPGSSQQLAPQTAAPCSSTPADIVSYVGALAWSLPAVTPDSGAVPGRGRSRVMRAVERASRA